MAPLESTPLLKYVAWLDNHPRTHPKSVGLRRNHFAGHGVLEHVVGPALKRTIPEGPGMI